LDILIDRFHTIQMDFMSAPMNKNGKDNSLIIFDKLTKLNTMIACKRTDSAITIAQLFFEHWYCRGFPLPHTIISDRDTKFVSDFWTSLMSHLDVKLTVATARHQQTNGLAELSHAVNTAAKYISNPSPKHWQLVKIILVTLPNLVGTQSLGSPRSKPQSLCQLQRQNINLHVSGHKKLSELFLYSTNLPLLTINRLSIKITRAALQWPKIQYTIRAQSTSISSTTIYAKKLLTNNSKSHTVQLQK
jgi:hypothetical protein